MRICFLMEPPRSSTSVTFEILDGLKAGGGPTFVRTAFVEYAAESIKHSFWAKSYYARQRAKGARHQAAVRALASQGSASSGNAGRPTTPTTNLRGIIPPCDLRP